MVETKNIFGVIFVNEEDYLKVVEEKEKLHQENEIWKVGYKELIKENEELKNKLEEENEIEEIVTLRYHLNINGVLKEVTQFNMYKEDAEELIGMDSDNWYKWEVIREVK